MIFARVVSLRTLNAVIGLRPTVFSAGVSGAASGRNIVSERLRPGRITILVKIEVVARVRAYSTSGRISAPLGDGGDWCPV